jgi:capsular exopolysaccharide synthesis family protein
MHNIDKSLVTFYQKFSIATEAYRGLRTNLLLQKSKNKEGCFTFVITSAHSGEGKSVTAANTAVTLAQSKHKTLLIDADMRKPEMHQIFGLECSYGLVSILEGSKSFKECVQQTEIQDLDVLVSEYKDIDPTELLSTKRLSQLLDEVTSKYDFIIFDTPPMCLITDTSLIICQIKRVLFVVSEGVTTGKELKNAKKNLENLSANILGVVLNRADLPINSYGNYYTKGESLNGMLKIINKIKKLKK